MAKNHNSNRRGRRHRVVAVADIAPAPGNNQITGPIGIQAPPDHIFKFRRNRIAPAQEVWGHGTVTYAPQRAEYIEGDGNFVYYYGVPYPSRTVAPAEAINAINGIKRLLISTLQLLASKDAKKPIIASFFVLGAEERGRLLTHVFDKLNNLADVTVIGFYLEDGYYCPVVRELRQFIQTLLIEIGVERGVAIKAGEVIGMLFEYDNAYRYRLQDILGAANAGALQDNLPKELERLIGILGEREVVKESGVVGRFSSGVRMLKYMWAIPKIRKGMRKAFNAMDLAKCRMDEGEIYHTLLYADYNVGGKTIDERMGMLKVIHGEDMATWPPRIMIRQGT